MVTSPAAAGAGGRGARVAEIGDHHRPRRAEGLGRGDVLLEERRVVARLDDRARQDVERRAAGMEVEERIAAREDLLREIGRDLLRDGAGGAAGEGAVEVEPVDRRRALARDDGVDVVGRHQDQPAGDVGRVEVADQLGDGDRPLVFVAVVAAFEDHRRPVAIGDDRDRQAGHAPGVVVRGVRDHDEPDALAGAVEIDGGEGGGFDLGCGHGAVVAAAGESRKGERQGKMTQASGYRFHLLVSQFRVNASPPERAAARTGTREGK